MEKLVIGLIFTSVIFELNTNYHMIKHANRGPLSASEKQAYTGLCSGLENIYLKTLEDSFASGEYVCKANGGTWNADDANEKFLSLCNNLPESAKEDYLACINTASAKYCCDANGGKPSNYGLPKGSYQQTCYNCVCSEDGSLDCLCKTIQDEPMKHSSLVGGCTGNKQIANINGNLTIED